MTEFQLDTSGAIALKHYNAATEQSFVSTMWPDLSPFEQGYVEALLRAITAENPPVSPTRFDRPYGFSDLAPVTLARIMEDCERVVSDKRWSYLFNNAAQSGTEFQSDRRETFLNRSFNADARLEWTYAFPPLTPYLGDDGLIYLRETVR